MLRFFSLFFLAVTLYAAQADWIVSARYVLTMDGANRLIENGAVAITADRIVAVGPAAEIQKTYKARHKLDRPNAILAPGLINTHKQAAMSLFRGTTTFTDMYYFEDVVAETADLITVSLDAPNAMPLYDVYSQMVYALKGSNVRDVMINGSWIVSDRKPLTLHPTETEFYRKQVSASIKK